MVMSDGSDVCGSGGRTLGRGAGRGTAGVSAVGVRNGSSVGRGVASAGLGSAFSIRSDLGVGVGVAPFSFGVGDFFPGVGLFLDFAFDLGVGDFFADGVGLTFLPGDFVGSGVADGFGVGDSSASSGLGDPFGVVLGSGVPVAFAFAFGVGVGVGDFFAVDLAFRFAGFGLALGDGVTDGVGEVTARISSRAVFFFSSLADCAQTSEPAITPRTSAMTGKTERRITAGERNRAGCVINSRKLSESRGLGHGLGVLSGGGPLTFASQNGV